MDEVFIIDAIRTPIGSFMGQYKKIESVNLGISCIEGIFDRNKNIEKKSIEGIILGQVLTAGLGMNTSRQVLLKSGLSRNSFAYCVNQVCGSGMRAVIDTSIRIKSNENQLLIAGGQENMSLARHTSLFRKGIKLGNVTMIDSILSDGLTDVFSKEHMGMTAENVAKKYKVSRKQQDKFAINSYKKAYKATKNNYFKNELIDTNFNDEFRQDTDLKKLSNLKPVFKSGGTVTAGNSSSLNDGASMILLGSQKYCKKNNIKPIAKIIGWADSAGDPDYMGITPIKAIGNLMKKLKVNIDFFDLIEVNEAFSATSVAVEKELGIDSKKLNICGGSIALGHPIGCSGARIITTLVHQLKRIKKKYGAASMCIGGGQGLAVAVEII
ncbi:MAG: acetyl-CoA C-acyltransferase [Pelagibacteraceae bacterium]|nr:acetyl-CoA C-acyltransferase [Pelagibacteraceae bacterium]|tara:strand:+ start:4269 stop:5414 length:1146 start_codon:yes stop_codon:yes gene_type:complete